MFSLTILCRRSRGSSRVCLKVTGYNYSVIYFYKTSNITCTPLAFYVFWEKNPNDYLLEAIRVTDGELG